jgi:hypothetical protein
MTGTCPNCGSCKTKALDHRVATCFDCDTEWYTGILIEVTVGNYHGDCLIHLSIAFDGYEHKTACGLIISGKKVKGVSRDIPENPQVFEHMCNRCVNDQ